MVSIIEQNNAINVFQFKRNNRCALEYHKAVHPGNGPPINFQHYDLKKIIFDGNLQRMLRNFCLLHNIF